jgi:predicted hydrocarbon binding protein
VIRRSDEKVPWSIDRFVDCLKPFANQDKIAVLTEGCGEINASANPLKKAEFAKCLMDSFERQFSEDVRIRVLEDCGRRCIGASTIERAKGIKRNAKNLAELIDALNRQHIGGGRLRLENNQINVEYGKCYCGMVSKTKERFSSTYCNCSRGYLLELFERIFEKPVKVDLVESVIQGAKSCKFVVRV